jgi:glycosyltransferase involved in cell wall biosynthesis
MPMKILMVSDVYFPRINGVSTSIQTFRRELARLGHTVDLIAPAYPGKCADEVGVTRIPSRPVPGDPEDRAMSPFAVRALHRSLASAGYDIVHIQTPFIAHYAGKAIARRLGIPCVETYHTFFEEYLFHYVPYFPKTWMRALARAFSRSQCNNISALVVPSDPMKTTLAGYGVTTPMHVIPTGISRDDLKDGDGRRFRARLSIPDTASVMLFVGRVAFEKNIEFLLRATAYGLHLAPDMLLVIAGEGPAEASMRRLARELGIDRNVRFIGYLDRKTDLPDCYRAADAFVFASRTETQGLVLLEAMTLGIPVISTAIMGTASIVGPRRGALVPEDDETQFAAAMVRMSQDAALRSRLAHDARIYASEWGADVMASRLAALYAATIASAPQKHRPADRAGKTVTEME